MLDLKDHYPRTNKGRTKGFTLLEMLTVLFIIGLAASLALPNLSLLFDRIKFSNERDSVFRKINLLPYQALSQNQDLVLVDEVINKKLNQREINLEDFLIPSYNISTLSLAKIDLPDGWRISLEQPIFYKASGFCNGGLLSLSIRKLSYNFKLSPPYCQIKENIDEIMY